MKKKFKLITFALAAFVLMLSSCGTKFVVTFDSDGGSLVDQQIVVRGNTATIPENPVKEGFTFNNWYKDGVVYNFGLPVTEDITLTAKWDKITPSYKVTFDVDGIEAQSIKEGEKASEPSQNPVKEGYVFKGWLLNDDYYDFNSAVTADITLTADWAKLLKVTFDAEGIKAQTVEEGKKAVKPETDPVKTGFVFKGWTLNDADYDFTSAVTADITLKAKWAAVFTVSFSEEKIEAQKVESGNKAVKPETDPVKDGYTFKEWTLNDAAYDFDSAVTADITLTAAFTPVEYTITYVLNGGENAANPVKYTIESDDIALLDPVKKPADKPNFAGWYTDKELTTQISTISKGSKGNLTLYAKYSSVKVYKVTFYNGDTVIDTINVEEGNKAAATSKTVEGCTLKGNVWYTDKTFKTAYSFSKTVTSDLKLYGNWTVNTYKITFKNGETTVAEKTVNYNATTTAPASPEKAGYTFDGWFNGKTQFNATAGIKADAVYTAKFTVIEYTITYTLGTGETNGENAPVKYTVDDEVTLPVAAKTGYTFNGWKTTASGTPAKKIAKGSTGNKAFIPDFTIITYTVKFASSDGTTIPSQTVNYGGKITAPSVTFTGRDGYTANGKWYAVIPEMLTSAEKADKTDPEIDFSTYTVTSDLTVYAGFTKTDPVIIKTSADAIQFAKDGTEKVVDTNLPADYTFKRGDLVTIKISGVSKYPVRNLAVQLIDCAKDTTISWSGSHQDQWGSHRLTANKTFIDDVLANTAFIKEIQLLVFDDAVGTGKDSHKVTIKYKDDENDCFIYDTLESLQADTYEGTVYNASVTPLFPIKFVYDGSGRYSLNDSFSWKTGITGSTVLKKRDTVKLTFSGCPSVEMKNVRLQIVDNTEPAGWWKTLSGEIKIADTLEAKKDFDIPVEIPITVKQIGSNNAAHKLIIISDYNNDTAESNNPPVIFEKGHDFDAIQVVTKKTYEKTAVNTNKNQYGIWLQQDISDLLNGEGVNLEDYAYLRMITAFYKAAETEGDPDVLMATAGNTNYSGVGMLKIRNCDKAEGDDGYETTIYNLNAQKNDEYASTYIPMDKIGSKNTTLIIQDSYADPVMTSAKLVSVELIPKVQGAEYYSTPETLIAAMAEGKKCVVFFQVTEEEKGNYGLGGFVNDSYGDCGAVEKIKAPGVYELGTLYSAEFEYSEIGTSPKHINLYNGGRFEYAYVVDAE